MYVGWLDDSNNKSEWKQMRLLIWPFGNIYYRTNQDEANIYTAFIVYANFHSLTHAHSIFSFLSLHLTCSIHLNALFNKF